MSRTVRSAIRVVAVAIFATVLGCSAGSPEPATAQQGTRLPHPPAEGEKLDGMTIEEYDPVSTLRVPGQPVTTARYPYVDVHSHWFRAATMSDGAVDTLIAQMDSLNLAVIVNLSGGSGERLAANVRGLEGRHPERFVTFANVSFDSVGAPGWTERAVARLAADLDAGARGLKIYKNLGMDVRDVDGIRVPVDDPRLDPIWALCGERGVPVLIHTADPAMFWEPRDRFNERWLELKLNPGRYRPPDRYPPFEDIMAEQYRMFAKHPGTTFINAHLGWYGSDLDRLGAMLDALPNVVTEVGAVVQELGRQPRRAREFLVRYHDRVLFGKDTYRPFEYHTYFRTFETADEYFPYYRKYHAFWSLYGLDLPDDVLRDIYYRNALRIIPGLDPSLFPE
jgi:predicted TIM-barrel fold metal-dependent hydrolase